MNEYLDMQTAAGNPQQNYAADYTDNYQVRDYGTINVHENTFNVQLLGKKQIGSFRIEFKKAE